MIISEKQISQLIAQLHDHIALYERLSSIAMMNHDYAHWLRELRDEITEQQSEELREINDQ